MATAVLALQGAFIEHEHRLEELGEEVFELRDLPDLAQPFDRLVLPGGESTVQAKLLRALQEKKIRPIGGTKEINITARIICASNADLLKCVEEGTFRKDLYYRLNAFVITIPPLRKRPGDIPAIVESMLQALSHKYHRRLEITPEAIAVLQSYQWPGNVRELQNLMERAVLLANGQPIQPAHFLLEDEEWPLFDEDEQEDRESASPAPADSAAPGTGMIRTAVVLLFIIPIAHSSAMIPAIVVSFVSPGIAIISSPTEHTQVMASSFSSVNAPA